MNLGSVLIALPVFFLLYQAVGLVLEAREHKAGAGWHPEENAAARNFFRELSQISAKLGFNKVLLKNKSLNDRLELLLLRAGYPFGWKAEDFLFFKELAALLAVLWLWKTGTEQPMVYLMGIGLGFWLPDVYMKAKGTARQAEIQKKLPGFVDLLSLALESGLDLLAAIDRILEKMRPSSLKEELSMLLQENRLGTPRKEAFEHLAHRVNLPDVQSLTSIIIQSEELGTGLSAVLGNYAEDMRNRRILRAEESAGKAPVKLLFPMLVFFFPIVFIIIFGPLALNFMASYK